MFTAHTSALPFKDIRLRSQVPTWASILACTFDQFCSNWRLSPNRTPSMQTGPLLQRKGPGRVLLPFQAPNRKPSLLSKFILAPDNRLLHSLYVQTAGYKDSDRGYLCRKRTSKNRSWFLIPKSTEQGLQSEETGGNPVGPTARSLTPPSVSRSHAPPPADFDTSC